MTDAIVKITRQLVGLTGNPIDALAVSLSCEFLARAACEFPALFKSIALVSPTSLSRHRKLRRAAAMTWGKRYLYALLRYPGWDRWVFGLLIRPQVIRYYLERTWGSKFIDEDLWRADVAMSRYPGARFAPLSFLSGRLFSADIHAVYDAVRPPVWVSHGVRGDIDDFDQLAAFAARNRWKVSVFDTGALIYFEELNDFSVEYTKFLRSWVVATRRVSYRTAETDPVTPRSSASTGHTACVPTAD